MTTTFPVKILIVDDLQIVRDGMRSRLAPHAGWSICGEAESTPDAMRLVHETNPSVVIVELAHQRGGGLELIKQIASLKNAPRIVVCSMHDENIFALRALRAGARGYVPKREASEHLVKAVEQVIAGKIFVNAGILQQLQNGAIRSQKRDATSPLHKLTDRELEVFEAIGGGMSIHQIAASLFLSAKTVETYRDRTKRKLNLRTSANLLYYAVRWSSEQPRVDADEANDTPVRPFLEMA